MRVRKAIPKPTASTYIPAEPATLFHVKESFCCDRAAQERDVFALGVCGHEKETPEETACSHVADTKAPPSS